MQNPSLCSIYAQAVFDGKRTLERVPDLLREGVEELLVGKYTEAILNQSKSLADVPETIRSIVEEKVNQAQETPAE